MREKITKAILAHVDGEMRIINLQAIVDEIMKATQPNTPWSEIDPKKWGSIGEEIIKWPEYTNEVFPPGHWEVDDAGYTIWVDDVPAEGGDPE